MDASVALVQGSDQIEFLTIRSGKAYADAQARGKQTTKRAANKNGLAIPIRPFSIFAFVTCAEWISNRDVRRVNIRKRIPMILR